MCDYITGKNLLPGWTCCECRVYNGLQRPVCRRCGCERHDITIPKDLIRCECGFGIEPRYIPHRTEMVCPSCKKDGLHRVMRRA